MSIEFDDSDIVAALGQATYAKGMEIWSSDAVLMATLAPDAQGLVGMVRGTADRAYEQRVRISRHGHVVRFAGACTCPVQRNCKHVAAMLLDWLASRAESNAQDLAAAEAARARPARSVSAAASAAPATASLHATSGATARAIPGELSAWLDRLGRLTAAAQGAMPRDQGQRQLLLVLDHETKPHERGAPSPRIRLLTARASRSGFTDPKPYSAENAFRQPHARASFLTPADVALLGELQLLRHMGRGSGHDIVLGRDALSRQILTTAAALGRLRFGSTNGPQLRTGPAVDAEPRWLAGERGTQRLSLVPAAAAGGGGAVPATFERLLATVPPLYVDTVAGTIGDVRSPLPPHIAAEVAAAPVVEGRDAAMVREKLASSLATQRPAPLGPASDDIFAAANAGKAADDAVAPPPLTLPLPEVAATVKTRSVVPTPCLELLTAQARVAPAHAWYAREARHRQGFTLPVARLAFDYAGDMVHLGDGGEMIERLDGDCLQLTRRDHKAELAAAERLARAGLAILGRSMIETAPELRQGLYLAPPPRVPIAEAISLLDEPERHLAFATDVVPALIGEGWRIEFAADYPYRVADETATWWADTGEASGIDWFSFELGIEVAGHRISLVPRLAELIAGLPPGIAELAIGPSREGGAGDNDARHAAFLAHFAGRKLWHTLPDGRLLPLPGERLAPMVKALIEIVGVQLDGLVGDKVRLHRAATPALAEFAAATGLDVTWAASAEKLIELGRSLKRGRTLARIEPPAGLRATLRPYQADGVAWLDFLREAGFGGVLADDMGLGKTVQALAFLLREKAAGRLDRPAIILAPTSVLPNWQAEAARFAPELKVLALRGSDRHALFNAIPEHDLVLSTYPLLARDHEALLAQEYHAAILDEAQAIKNPKASISALAHRIVARHRIALTGTPLENNLGEVWSLFEFLSPGLLGDESTFRRTFRTPIEKHGDQAVQAFLTRRLKPFMLRRTKPQVAKELPPKTEIVERVRLEGAQRDLYETVRALMHRRVRQEIDRRGLAKSHIVFLDALLKLRQVCCDPRLLKMAEARRVRSSAKLERLMEMIPELVGEGRRILLFSQFTSMLALIEEELARLKLPYAMLTGDTEDRAAPVAEFQSGRVPLFLLSLKAGGTGLNLTAADTVIHYDPWWNPAVENQATDRAYRIGQDKPVFVYKLIVEEGIETAIEQLKARKAALAEALFAGGSRKPLDLSEADISALFAPLADTRQLKKAA